MATDVNFGNEDNIPLPPPEGGLETSYIFVRTLGAGAFAEANLYKKTEDNSLVVWKEINMARLGEKECRDANNEIDILFLLNHANIVTYYNHFMDGSTLLIELEYANGGTLSDKIDQQEQPFEEERCEVYDYKTDVWSLGCVLSELLTLSRTFLGTNKLQLAYEIVCGTPISIDAAYSPEIRKLVEKMLKKWGGGRMTPQKQDIFVKGRSAAQVSAGHSHFAVVTMEKELYTWANVQGGSKIVGQLGHGNTASYKTPKKVEAFEGVGIVQAECGEDFTVCLTDEGQVYTFGSNFYGCLGMETDSDEVTSPVCVETFANLPVQEIICGDNHVVALTKNGDVSFPSTHHIKHVYAGSESTFLLTQSGRVLAAGSNEHNKLGFNANIYGIKKHKPKVYDIPCKLHFALVRPLMRLNVQTIAAGNNHSAVIDICGHLHTFGCNKNGQLGSGDFKSHSGICRVSNALANHRCTFFVCRIITDITMFVFEYSAPNTDSKTIVNFSAGQEDSAFSDLSPVYQQTGSDITSSLLSGDSGKPNSPDGSLPFSSMPKASNSLHLGLPWAKTESDLPPWLEAELEDEVIPIPAGFVIQSPGIINPYANQNDSKNTKELTINQLAHKYDEKHVCQSNF
ncbi:NEK9-like protein [Mya arenaria]|uniref:non-specific serine/threonine protein kinase n=1 Tax=Mya arenaria TaxID=6604 RepID=A0ABY7FEM4_MYAAR|nr:NEK9-like protein [Mya arenaria]